MDPRERFVGNNNRSAILPRNRGGRTVPPPAFRSASIDAAATSDKNPRELFGTGNIDSSAKTGGAILKGRRHTVRRAACESSIQRVRRPVKMQKKIVQQSPQVRKVRAPYTYRSSFLSHAFTVPPLPAHNDSVMEHESIFCHHSDNPECHRI